MASSAPVEARNNYEEFDYHATVVAGPACADAVRSVIARAEAAMGDPVAFAALKKPVKIDWIDVPAEMRDRYQYFTEANIVRLLQAGLSKPQWSLERGVADYLSRYLLREDSL